MAGSAAGGDPVFAAAEDLQPAVVAQGLELLAFLRQRGMMLLSPKSCVTAVAAASAMLAGCADRTWPPARLWQSVTLAQARSIIEEAGGEITRVRDTKDGDYLIEAALPGNEAFTWEGMSCKGPARACTEYSIAVDLPAGSEARARQLALERDVYYVADGYDGADYRIWRMGFTYGGVTEAHLRQVLIETLNVARSAREEIAAAEAGAGGGKPAAAP